MEQKIKEVNDYFKQKIVSGQYDIIKTDNWVIELKVDQLYDFSIWMANKPEGIETYNNSFQKSFMQLEFSKKEKKAIWNNLNEGYILENKKLIKQQIKDLENEL